MSTTDTHITAMPDQQAAIPQLYSVLDTLVQRLPNRIAIWHLEDADDPTSFRLIKVNYSASPLHPNLDMRAQIGKRIKEVIVHVPDEVLQRYVEALRSGESVSLAEIPYADERYGEAVLNIQAIPLSPEHLCISVENITARKQAEQALRQAVIQEEIIRAQQAALAELSTPLLMINDTTMIMPLVGTVDSRRVGQIMETLLQGVATRRASTVILDITGVAIVDTQVADAFIRASQAVSLLGAQVVLTGIRPEVAQTLVQLGVDLHSIITRGTLQDGITYALRV
ncbi:MAG: STAS domain-containing protein [Roseiflexaceae bacterium]